MSGLAAIILAGGAGSRLGGVDKARLRIGGVPLLQRVLAAIGADASPVVFASGSAALDPVPDLVIAPDRPGLGAGPLAGIAAAVLHLRETGAAPELVVSVAVDTPFFPADFVVRARAALVDGHGAVVGTFAGQPYPTNALWRWSVLETLPERLLAPDGPHSPSALLAEVNAAPLDWAAPGVPNPFANLNTLADLIALERRALAGGRVSA